MRTYVTQRVRVIDIAVTLIWASALFTLVVQTWFVSDLEEATHWFRWALVLALLGCTLTIIAAVTWHARLFEIEENKRQLRALPYFEKR